jgi:hydroxymethylpyrimidine/phosphomethylpyrimidine kinase
MKCLTIAGFDNSGGAGLLADVKTFSAWGTYGMATITAIAAQNTQGVASCYPVPSQAVEAQLHTIFDDVPPHAIKTGMLFDSDIVRTVARVLATRAYCIPVVVDPVLVANDGSLLLRKQACQDIIEHLLPVATLVTPNLHEAYQLAGDYSDRHKLASKIADYGCQAVLVKGGHDDNASSDDLLFDKNKTSQWFSSDRIATNNTHGTGCTLSAAITAALAQGLTIAQACRQAKSYLTGALRAAQSESVGQGVGPVQHFYQLGFNNN